MKALLGQLAAALLAPFRRWQKHKDRRAEYRIRYEREERKP